MEIAQLERVLAVVKSGTLSAAADELHISQPGLSRSIKHRESELGTTLFFRSKNSMALSDQGQKLLPYMEAVVFDANKLRSAAQGEKKHDEFVIKSCAPAPLWKLVLAV